VALSGPEALRSLDEAVRDIRREEDDISKRLARSGERVAKIREAEAELFRELARLRLDPDARASLDAPLTGAEKRARAMLEEHGRSLAAIDVELEGLDKELAGRARRRREMLEEVDRHQAELRALSSSIAQAIAKDPEYGARQKAAAELRAIASESLRKTEQAEADREQKGRPYREDPLFMYLWERGYGTRNYKASNLIRWLDSKVARMVRYQDARPNFAMLNDIPLRLREHAERQAALAQQAEDGVDAIELAAIDAAGGKPVRQALAAAQARIEALDAEMLALEDERDEKTARQRQLVEGRDPAFEEATRVLAGSLQATGFASLLEDARRTPSPSDDAVVAKIEDSRKRISEEEAESAEHRSRLKVLAARRRELEDIEFEFKKARFDDPRSVFREDRLAGDLLNEFLRGAITAATYWGHWQRSQSWRPGSSDWGGGIGLPRSGRSGTPTGGGFSWPSGSGSRSTSTPTPWGRSPSGAPGGFSRPRSGSSGTRKSGGFKTGGGF